MPGRRVLLLLAAALALGPSRPAAQVVSCSVSSAGVSFGAYNPLLANATAPLDGAGTISYTCSRRTPVVITLSTGQSNSFAMRQMGRAGSATDKLQYNLYLDSARTSVWGDQSLGNGHFFSGTGRRPVSTVAVYGRVPENQDAVPGSYSDQTILTIQF